MQPQLPEPSLITLDTYCAAYADAYHDLSQEVTELTQEIEDLKRTRMQRIKRLVARAAGAKSDLAGEIQRGSHLFVKPRTYVIRGIKIGFEKGKGKLDISDPDRTIELIKRHYDEAESATLLHTKVTPDKKALSKLPANELKRLGCELADTTDQVVIKPVDGDVEKLVNALLKDGEELPTEQSAAA